MSSFIGTLLNVKFFHTPYTNYTDSNYQYDKNVGVRNSPSRARGKHLLGLLFWGPCGAGAPNKRSTKPNLYKTMEIYNFDQETRISSQKNL